MCEAFNDKDIQQQLTIKVALDPNSLLNPGKFIQYLENVLRKEEFMSMEEKQNSQTFLDFNQNVFKPSSREEIVEIVKIVSEKTYL